MTKVIVNFSLSLHKKQNLSSALMKTSKLLILLAFFTFFSCEKPKENAISTDITLLDQAFDTYRENSIEHRRFKYADVIHLVNKRKDFFQVEKIGESVQNKSIYQMTVGNGPTKVMLWSQMHGNESTATMALFDLMNFLEGENDAFTEIRNALLENLQIRILPMVNPDGMDSWVRRNALEIDLNRDAVALTSPEAVILKEARDQFKPEFGFNLHDQQIYYNVSQTEKPATISVLAPAFNYETEVNDVRKKAMQVIIGMNETLEQLAPGQVGKYDDAFEPRAFGDNFQKWGTSTILIESGGYHGDPEKQYIRKLNFIAILKALLQIADQSYQKYQLEEYYAIPDNDQKLMDLLIKNVNLKKSGFEYQADIGIKRRESDAHNDYFVSGVIDDLGDLSVFYGYEELDATGLEIIEGKVFKKAFENLSAISQDVAFNLLQQGYLAVKVKNAEEKDLHQLPIIILNQSSAIPMGIYPGGSPNFFLADANQLKFAVVNGYLIDLNNSEKKAYKMRVY